MTHKWQCYLVKLKNKNCQNIKRLSKYKKTVPLFLFPEGKMHHNLSFCFNIYASVLLKQYLTKHICYKIYGYFDFQLAHIITPK